MSARVKPARSVHDGETNATHMLVHREVLGGPMVVGDLYRVRVWQGEGGKAGRNQAIMEYAGEGPDPIAPQETAYRWIIRNPPLPLAAKNGTPEHPWIVWPMDIDYIAHAEPGDLDVPMVHRTEGDPIDKAVDAQTFGRPPTGSA